MIHFDQKLFCRTKIKLLIVVLYKIQLISCIKLIIILKYLEAMGTSEIQDDDGAVKSPTRYTTPPRLMNLPKPKPKGSRDEPEQETRCDIPVTVKSDQPNIYYSLAPKDVDGEKGSPVYVEIPEETSFSGFEYPSETTEQNTGKSVEVDDKFYESMH